MDLDPERLWRSPFVIGALGALVTALKFMPGASWPEKVVNLVAGSLVAGFTAPALIEWLHLTSPAYQYGTAFAIGLLGLSLCAAVLQAIKDTPLGQIVTGWLQGLGGIFSRRQP